MSQELLKQISNNNEAYLLGLATSSSCKVDKKNDEKEYQLSFHKTVLLALTDELKKNFYPELTFQKRLPLPDVVLKNILSHIKSFDNPSLPDMGNEFVLSFFRGYFDGSKATFNKTDFMVSFPCPSSFLVLLASLAKYTVNNIKRTSTFPTVTFYGTNSLDFLSKLYDTVPKKLRYHKYYRAYIDFTMEVDSFSIPTVNFKKTLPDAVTPSKPNCSDEGYDLTMVKVDKVISKDIVRFDTGIQVQPSASYHIEIFPRSSLSNSGWMLSNSIGLIDSSYRGNLKVCLTRVSPTASDIVLPFKGVQMVLRKNAHYLFNEVDVLDDTKRADGGFGSTNKQ